MCCVEDSNIFLLGGAAAKYVKRVKNVFFPQEFSMFLPCSSQTFPDCCVSIPTALGYIPTCRKVFSPIFTTTSAFEKEYTIILHLDIHPRKQFQIKFAIGILSCLKLSYRYCFFGNCNDWGKLIMRCEWTFRGMKQNEKLSAGQRLSDQSLYNSSWHSRHLVGVNDVDRYELYWMREILFSSKRPFGSMHLQYSI